VEEEEEWEKDGGQSVAERHRAPMRKRNLLCPWWGSADTSWTSWGLCCAQHSIASTILTIPQDIIFNTANLSFL
jgi:hypothetical protein